MMMMLPAGCSKCKPHGAARTGMYRRQVLFTEKGNDHGDSYIEQPEARIYNASFPKILKTRDGTK